MRKRYYFLLLLLLPSFSLELAAQTAFSRRVIECYKTARREDRRICRTITPPEYYESVLMAEKLKLTTVQVDLDGNGRKELVVWESSWAGSSGGGLWIFSKSGTRLKRLIEADMTWSPIILMKTKHKGWLDLAYLQAGGGVDELFITLRYNGKRYAVSRTMVNRPKGTVLIGRDWERSFFGPLK